MIKQVETWKAFIVENQTHYNQTNESRFNLVELTPEERGWTEIFQYYPPVSSSGGTGTSPINGRSYSWTYGFLPVGYFGVNNQSRVFTSSETWTCPEGVNEIYVRCIGRGADATSSNGGGGGGFIMTKISVVPGNSYSITIDSTASSFGGVVSALAASGANGGSFTYTEDVKVLFKGYGGQGYGGGGGGGSELGDGGYGGAYGGGGLHSGKTIYSTSGGGGMIGANTSSGGAGFMSKAGTGSYGKGMFSAGVGLKFDTSPYYNKLSVDITEDLGVWGTPNNYGGGINNSTGNSTNMFSGGINSAGDANHHTFGGFGGGGGGIGDSTSSYQSNGGYGGGGGYGTKRGGTGGSGGGGGCGGSKSGNYGGNGGYGGGGGQGYYNGSYGQGLVIIEW